MKKRLSLFIVSIFFLSFLLSACSSQTKIIKSKYKMFEPEKTWAVLMEMNDFPGENDMLVDFINTKRMNDTLIRLGVEESHIKISQDELSYQSVSDATKWLEENSKKGDTVLFYVFSHGSYLNNTVAWNTMFPKRWQRLEDREQILIVAACGSEKFIDELSKDKSSEISISNCSAHENAWAGLEEEGLPIIGDVWTYYFTDSVFNPKADVNEDEMITLEEAFTYTTPNTQKYMEEVVFEVEEFLQMYIDVGQNLDNIGNYPNPVIHSNDSKELILYKIANTENP